MNAAAHIMAVVITAVAAASTGAPSSIVDGIETWSVIVGMATFVVGAITSVILLYRANKTADRQVREIGEIVGRTEQWANRMDSHSGTIGQHSASLVRLEVSQDTAIRRISTVERKLDISMAKSAKAHEALSKSISDLERSFLEHVNSCLARAAIIRATQDVPQDEK